MNLYYMFARFFQFRRIYSAKFAKTSNKTILKSLLESITALPGLEIYPESRDKTTYRACNSKIANFVEIAEAVSYNN